MESLKNQRLHNLLRAIDLEIPRGLANPVVKKICCDSRRVEPGSLFVGLQGEMVNGGDFWPQALSSGAVAAVIGEEVAKKNPPGSNDAVVVVPEPVGQWAGELASIFWGEPSLRMSLIGVTGTNGKTTIAHLIEYLSKAVGRPCALFGTVVNRWPGHSFKATHTTAFAETLQAQLALAVQGGAQVGVMEVSSHALAQSRVAGCNFSGAIFTNLTQDHLDYHSSMKAYFEAKALLFDAPLFRKGISKAVINIDDSWGLELAQRLGDKCWRSSLMENNFRTFKPELRINELEETSKGVVGLLHTPLGEGRFLSPLIGRFNLMNLLQAIGVLIQQDFPLTELLAAISDFPGVPGRMQRIRIEAHQNLSRLPTVLVDYAHTPDGLKNALIASRSSLKGDLICVFGCGGDRDRGKRAQMGAIAEKYADRLIVTSDNPRTEDPEKIIEDVLEGMTYKKETTVEIDRAVAIDLSILNAASDDVVLIAGKGHEDYQIFGVKRVHFDDRVEAENALLRKLRSE